MGMGIGAAMTGLRVIIEGMNMGFLLLAYNQISNNAGMLHYTSGGQYKVRPAHARHLLWQQAANVSRSC
jgi:pyruvate/2-oxoglutarate/acetoin dehydrogenase E1 component